MDCFRRGAFAVYNIYFAVLKLTGPNGKSICEILMSPNCHENHIFYVMNFAVD